MDVEQEAARLKGILAQVLGAMQAMHPDNNSDLSNAEYARLWNATVELLEAEAAPDSAAQWSGE